jgi:copper chaperone
MQLFRVDDMTCGHCVGVITKAVQSLDANAKVAADLGRHLVTVEGTAAEASALRAAIAEAGYTPVSLETQPSAEKLGSRARMD